MNFTPEAIEQYCLNKSTLPSSLCDQLEDYTRKNIAMPQMLSGKAVGSFLGLMVHMIKAKKILEVGSFTGYATLCMAENTGPQGHVDALEISPDNLALAKSYWKQSSHGEKISGHLGPALESLAKLKGPYDLVFIDADKANYLNYLKYILDHQLLSSHGVIILDNCLWSGRVVDPQDKEESTRAIRQVNDYIASRSELYGHLLPLRDGLFIVTPLNA